MASAKHEAVSIAAGIEGDSEHMIAEAIRAVCADTKRSPVAGEPI